MIEFDEIQIKFINHKEQRYETAGDYYLKGKTLHMRISKCEDQKSGKRNRLIEFWCLIHEMVEVLLVIARNISIDKIDEFDMSFKGEDEPGDDPAAPYYKEHQFATIVDKQMAAELLILNKINEWED